MVDIKPNIDLIAKLGDSVSFHEGDVADYDSQARCFQEAWDKHGRLDLVCANAGIGDQRQVGFFRTACMNIDMISSWSFH